MDYFTTGKSISCTDQYVYLDRVMLTSKLVYYNSIMTGLSISFFHLIEWR